MKDIDEKLKYEVATELGLIEKIKKYGWKSLSAKETGRIGGLITKKKKMLEMEKGQ
ncbi:small, acid-soluble spore protein, alpha/beta type [Acetivibrio clariflavus]|uniref:Small, acid-soluble spore protein, alpha/beta type n=1 Tax=Acetivibrio clariflavus (strain DSM 19732 / NBRC 101661 / EBR45) TaxID=720554 RepID=G8LT18_ACECE|nr:small, acid-soluble spore protein, alpha/beta type [Acetivibrio clariflavus]AEV67222.1 small, acid-soluble spore protein, alpha/beta type [Acetivibrio clariflavus DSM 19732]